MYFTTDDFFLIPNRHAFMNHQYYVFGSCVSSLKSVGDLI